MENLRTRKRIRLAWDVEPTEPQVGRDEAAGRLQSPPWREDDRDGHYVFDLGENLTRRYKILKKVGEGTFGRVLECWDREKHEYVAIKVIRSIRKYRHAAMIEIDVLNHLAKNDKGASRCLQIRNWFDYRNHICIVCEKLGPSLYEFLRRNKYSPFPVDLVREFGRQLLEAVAYMHDLRLIHTDLKPENILLESSEHVKVPRSKNNFQDEMHFRCLPKSSAIKLIDFGSTVFENQDHSSVVSTRHYRAPEIILDFRGLKSRDTDFFCFTTLNLSGFIVSLVNTVEQTLRQVSKTTLKKHRTAGVIGLGWSYPCDIWSVGCILVELCSGTVLFQTHENLEHLAMMERVLGPVPVHMIRNSNVSAAKFFRRGARLNWPEGAVSRESIRAVRKVNRLKDLVFQYVEYSRTSLTDLLHGLLKFEPSERLTAREALDHPFFRNPM